MGSRINWNKIRDKADFILVRFGVTKFPLKIYDLISSMSDIKLITYKDAAELENTTVKEIEEKLTKSDEAATLKKDDMYYIFYNDNTMFQNPRRIRYTLAHEFGHIMLEHFNGNKSLLSRHGFSSDEYEQLEVEANFFASELLSPRILVNTKWDISTISDAFDISKDSATRVEEFIKNNQWIYRKPSYLKSSSAYSYLPVKDFQEILPTSPFDFKYILKDLDIYYCDKCHSLSKSPSKILLYCPICGNLFKRSPIKESNLFKLHEKEGENMKKYSSINLNEDSYPKECPICGTSTLDDEPYFCEICGIYLYNRCSGLDGTVSFSADDFEPCNQGEFLSGCARYCPYCGCPSTYYLQNILSDYKSELRQTGLDSLVEQALQSN